MKKTRSWLILLAVAGAAGTFAVQNALNSKESPATPPTEALPSPIPAGQCAYAWANYDIPEISERIESSIQAINPSASARAQAFGEDCVSSDGQEIFTARQTDFSVRLPVAQLTNEEEMGNWIAQVMPVILQLPPEELQGSQPGSVRFIFIQTESQQIHLSVPIYSYPEFSRGKTGIELFRYYHLPPTSPT